MIYMHVHVIYIHGGNFIKNVYGGSAKIYSKKTNEDMNKPISAS
jgi:hypothetical protein